MTTSAKVQKLHCTKCKKQKPISDFRERKELKRGYQSWCRQCENELNKKRYKPRPRKIKPKKIKDPKIVKLEAKKRMLKHRYGITLEEYNEMYINQGKKCAICDKPKKLSSLYVDHCHKSNGIRGLLCPACNSGIGKLKEDRQIFENAMEYLGI